MPASLCLDWIYRFTNNEAYPDPLEEIDALCTLDSNDEQTYLLLANRNSPPMSRAARGDVIGLCTAREDRLILHGTAVVAGSCIRGATPVGVQGIYGNLNNRVFCPLTDIRRVQSTELSPKILNDPQQANFLRGQPCVKRLTARRRSSGMHNRDCQASMNPQSTYPELRLCPPNNSCEFVAVGLDPTAGTWESQMTTGPKLMPSFAIKWNGSEFRPHESPLAWHQTNECFFANVRRRQPTVTCIDGPCGTNGPRILRNQPLWSWDPRAPRRPRDGELALSAAGISLFWTTQNTVMNFDGASRWIARSLELFANSPGTTKIETHPHGAFTFLRRLFNDVAPLPNKSTEQGRLARIAMLRVYISGLAAEMVPNHDAVDAACAALVAGLHQLGLTTPFGTDESGGQIWMPDVNRLRQPQQN
ncbi:MAG: DUF429 domain-containing protein [Planctomyces sp.]